MVYYLGLKRDFEQYPENEFLDGDRANIALEGPLTKEMRLSANLNQTHQFNIGYPVEANNVPNNWMWASEREMSDFYTPEGFPCVSKELKLLIERLDAGVHQFFPLQVVNKAGEQIAERWLWVVCNLIDSVDREHTNLEFRNNIRWRADKVANPRLVFNSKQIGSCHFWRDKHLSPGNLLCSDEAGRAIEAAGLTGIGLKHKETV